MLAKDELKQVKTCCIWYGGHWAIGIHYSKLKQMMCLFIDEIQLFGALIKWDTDKSNEAY